MSWDLNEGYIPYIIIINGTVNNGDRGVYFLCRVQKNRLAAAMPITLASV